MPQAMRTSTASRAAVFAPLDSGGRAELVAQRLTDAIVLGVLADGERLPGETELAKKFGVATVTAREALEVLRHRGLVETRRGRDGGSFVTSIAGDSSGILFARVSALSRVELRDMGVYYSVITSSAAELAADRSTSYDVEELRRLVHSFDTTTGGSARRGESGFHLELAALSQSARLVHEELRLQAEFGPLFWLSMQEPVCREGSRQAHSEIVDAIADFDGARARKINAAHVAETLEWLIEEKSTMERGGE